MQAFASRQADSEVRARLLAALAADSSDERFRAVAAESNNLARRWSRHYRDQVLERVDAWAQANGVPADILEVKPGQEPPGSSSGHGVDVSGNPYGAATLAVGKREVDVERLRDLICEAVREMPLSDLLRLPIPAEYMLRR